MIPACRTLPIASAILPAAALAADTVTMSPGRWEETTTVMSATIDGKPAPVDLLSSANETEYSCISPEEAAEPRRYFLQSKEGDKCVPDGTAANGRIDATATCGGDGAGKSIVLSGSYGPKTYAMNARVVLAMGAKPLEVQLQLRGRFVGACTGDETP